jgi:hypothetical protein
VQERIQQGQQMLPTAIAALPAGEIRLTDADANAFFAANSASLAPLESLRVQFVPGQVQADVGIYGTRVRVISDIAVQDGRLRVVNPRIDGPLSYVLSMEDLIRPIEQQFNDQIIGQGQIVREARIEQGQLVVVVGQS